MQNYARWVLQANHASYSCGSKQITHSLLQEQGLIIHSFVAGVSAFITHLAVVKEKILSFLLTFKFSDYLGYLVWSNLLPIFFVKYYFRNIVYVEPMYYLGVFLFLYIFPIFIDRFEKMKIMIMAFCRQITHLVLHVSSGRAAW